MLIPMLWLAQIILFVGGWLGPWRSPAELAGKRDLPRAVRMVLSFSLCIAALLIWQGGVRDAVYAQWVCFGMFVSFIGDLMMARLIPFPNRLIGGMIAFGIAHALYVTAYLQTIQANRAELVNPGLGLGIGFYAIVSILGWAILIRNPQKPSFINIGALVYGMWIGTMAMFALTLAVAVGGAYWLTALGGLIFVASDFIIGITDIRGMTIKDANVWVWLTYLAGQMGIIYAGWLR